MLTRKQKQRKAQMKKMNNRARKGKPGDVRSITVYKGRACGITTFARVGISAKDAAASLSTLAAAYNRHFENIHVVRLGLPHTGRFAGRQIPIPIEIESYGCIDGGTA